MMSFILVILRIMGCKCYSNDTIQLFSCVYQVKLEYSFFVITLLQEIQYQQKCRQRNFAIFWRVVISRIGLRICRTFY